MNTPPHILIVESRFYEGIADELARGATQVLEGEQAKIDRLAVPGAFEIPAAVSMAIPSKAYDGYVALGCVIRGETSHYDHICGEVARGLNHIAIAYRVAIGFGVLTCENREQAWTRASVSDVNKGADAARACLMMVAHLRRLRTP